jgi:1,4-dihydroxy-2-naphthoyl-CoA synthase
VGDSRPLVAVAFNGMIAEVAIKNGPINLVTRELLRALNGVLTELAPWGLVNRVVSDGSALDGARELAATIVSRGPVSNRLAKKLVDAAQDLPLDAGLSMSTAAQQEIFDSSDLHEGVSAFFAKRQPEFKGR